MEIFFGSTSPTRREFSPQTNFSSWIDSINYTSAWKKVYKENFPKDEVENIIKVWGEIKNIDQAYGMPIYKKVIEPTIVSILKTIDDFLLKPETIEKGCVFASWVYTNGLSRLGLQKTYTKLELELNKRFKSIEIAPKIKNCCIGMCSACGRGKIVYKCYHIYP